MTSLPDKKLSVLVPSPLGRSHLLGSPYVLRDSRAVVDNNFRLKSSDKLNKLLAEQTGKSLKTIEKDTERDNFMTAAEACEYGLIDKVITKKEI